MELRNASECAEVIALRDALSKIASFRAGDLVDRQAHLMRETARIALVDSLTRAAYRAGQLGEIQSLWRDYCNGDLSLEALAQELGETLASRGEG